MFYDVFVFRGLHCKWKFWSKGKGNPSGKRSPNILPVSWMQKMAKKGGNSTAWSLRDTFKDEEIGLLPKRSNNPIGDSYILPFAHDSLICAFSFSVFC